MATLVDRRGRAKAYRPMAPAARAAALEAFVAAYAAGEFFEAHELLEPAWMGSPDPAERELFQGLIKLAAAFVHAARGNPAGIAKNLRGARDRLEGASATEERFDVPGLISSIDDRLSGLEAGHETVAPVPLTRTR
ncbi:MAG: DUF309 domain-containing protein [Chloroflexi bacterium]|nr:DUF309 domain-containing protein [Chloroflexota bacterium]